MTPNAAPYIFLAITNQGDHHYVLAKDFGEAWTILVAGRGLNTVNVTVLQRLNEVNLPPLSMKVA